MGGVFSVLRRFADYWTSSEDFAPFSADTGLVAVPPVYDFQERVDGPPSPAAVEAAADLFPAEQMDGGWSPLPIAVMDASASANLDGVEPTSPASANSSSSLGTSLHATLYQASSADAAPSSADAGLVAAPPVDDFQERVDGPPSPAAVEVAEDLVPAEQQDGGWSSLPVAVMDASASTNLDGVAHTSRSSTNYHQTRGEHCVSRKILIWENAAKQQQQMILAKLAVLSNAVTSGSMSSTFHGTWIIGKKAIAESGFYVRDLLKKNDSHFGCLTEGEIAFASALIPSFGKKPMQMICSIRRNQIQKTKGQRFEPVVWGYRFGVPFAAMTCNIALDEMNCLLADGYTTVSYLMVKTLICMAARKTYAEDETSTTSTLNDLKAAIRIFRSTCRRSVSSFKKLEVHL